MRDVHFDKTHVGIHPRTYITLLRLKLSKQQENEQPLKVLVMEGQARSRRDQNQKNLSRCAQRRIDGFLAWQIAAVS